MATEEIRMDDTIRDEITGGFSIGKITEELNLCEGLCGFDR